MSADHNDDATDDGVYNRNRHAERREGGGDRRGAAHESEHESEEDAAERGRVRAAIQKEIEADDGGAKPQPPTGTPVIEVRDVYLSFDRPVLEGVSFTAHEGETVSVVGESGTGKSTIIKLILRLLVADRGEVFVLGKDIENLTYEQALEIRQHMGMVFQGSALFDSLTVYENVAYPLREHTKLTDDEIGQRVREKLRYVDLDPDQVTQLAPSELSGGMQKRVGVARGLAANPKIMLYDEPTSGLDPLTTGTITNLIMKLQRDLNVTSVVVTHDIRSAFRMSSKIALLHEHRIVFFGSPEEMAASDDEYIQTFLGGY